MKNIHIMSIDWVDGENRETAIEQLVDRIAGSFPDAMVDGVPEDDFSEDGRRIIRQSFTSDTFDRITTSVAARILKEMVRMMEQVFDDEDFPASEQEKVIGGAVLVAAYNHLYHVFIGDEDEQS